MESSHQTCKIIKVFIKCPLHINSTHLPLCRQLIGIALFMLILSSLQAHKHTEYSAKVPCKHTVSSQYVCGEWAVGILYSGKFLRVQIFAKIQFPLQKKFSWF